MSLSSPVPLTFNFSRNEIDVSKYSPNALDNHAEDDNNTDDDY